MKKPWARTLATSLLCACAPSEPPRDDVLMARFLANEAAFESLLKNPDNQDLRRQLGIIGVHGEAGVADFWAWHYDFVGPGGMLTGFAHTREAPRPLVESIDELSSDPSEQKTLYRRIKGDWYLFYSSSN